MDILKLHFILSCTIENVVCVKRMMGALVEASTISYSAYSLYRHHPSKTMLKPINFQRFASSRFKRNLKKHPRAKARIFHGNNKQIKRNKNLKTKTSITKINKLMAALYAKHTRLTMMMMISSFCSVLPI